MLFDLARQHGAGARKLFTWAQGDGGPSEEPAPDGGVGYYWLNAERRLLRWDDPDPEFVQLNETLWGMADEAGGGGAAGAAGRYGESIGTHLRSAGTSPRMMALADAGYANTAGFELDDISLGHTIDCERHWNAHDGEHDYRSKTSKVAAAMSDGLRIQTRAVVEAVVYGRGDVQLHLRGEGGRAAATEGSVGGGEHEDGGGGASGPANTIVHARRVVVAVPVSVLSAGDITFSPPLPLLKVSAAAAIRLSPGCKVVLKFRRRFWPADCHGIICADSFMPEMWMDTVRGIGKDVHAAADGAADGAADDAQGGRGGGNAGAKGGAKGGATGTEGEGEECHYVTTFAMGAYATRVCSMPLEVAVDTILRQLGDMFCSKWWNGKRSGGDANTPREAYLGGFLVDWAKEPFTRGAYSCPTVTEPFGARAELAKPVDETLFFAGEATNHESMMTAHGAIESGGRAADEVLASLSRSVL